MDISSLCCFLNVFRRSPARKLSNMPMRFAAIWKPPWKSCAPLEIGPWLTKTHGKNGETMDVLSGNHRKPEENHGKMVNSWNFVRKQKLLVGG